MKSRESMEQRTGREIRPADRAEPGNPADGSRPIQAGGAPVRLFFAGETTLAECLRRYFTALKQEWRPFSPSEPGEKEEKEDAAWREDGEEQKRRRSGDGTAPGGSPPTSGCPGRTETTSP